MPNRITSIFGYTLIELLVTINIAGILLAIALPSYNSIISNNRLTVQANDFLASLTYTRSEAVKRNVQVTMLNKGADNQWQNGWDIFTDLDGSNSFKDDGDALLCETGEDCLLRTFPAQAAGNTIQANGVAFKKFIGYLPSGVTRNGFSTGTFKVCSIPGQNIPLKKIIINNAGRPRVESATGACP